MIQRPLTLFATSLCMATGVILGLSLQQAYPLGTDEARDTVLLNDTLRYVESHYVDPVTSSQLVDGALTGLFESLDEHSHYLDASAMRDLESGARGHYGGVGLEVSLVDGYFTVIRTIDHSPAERAGIKPGDRLTSVGRQSLRGKRLGDVIEMLRGTSGTELMVHVEQNGENRSIRLLRERIDFESVEGEEVAPGIGYIRISLFSDNTAEKVREMLEKLDAGSIRLRGLVMDLRNNPGGLLTSAVDVSDLFLDSGLIVRTAGRSAESNGEYTATAGDIAPGMPIAVLIDGATASAAEVVTGSLQDADRAIVIGSTTYGKGSVQTLFGVEGDRGIKLTTARYYTPSGKTIDGKGIKPDIKWTGEYDKLVAFAADTLLSTSSSSSGSTSPSANLVQEKLSHSRSDK